MTVLRDRTPFLRGAATQWLAAAVAVSAAALAWIGYRAIVEWRHAAVLVASRRADAAVDLLVAALSRDMRGVQQVILSAADRDGQNDGSPEDLLHPIAGAFARYPYPEAFFSWRESPSPSPVVFYTRAERRPAWLTGGADRNLFPVVLGSEPRVGEQLRTRVMQDAWQARQFSIFAMDLAGARYQIVTVLSYADPLGERLASAMGYMVNLEWARHGYFPDLLAQVNEIEGKDHAVRYALLDEQNRPVVGSAPDRDAPASRRVFPATFFDAQMVTIDPPRDLSLPAWTAVAATEGDPTLAAAERGAQRTLALAAVMAVTLAVALVLSLQAARARARLADMRGDFVSAVTHELKTPIANMRAINETLAAGRNTPESTREYAQMAIREANRLTRLVYNLLAYSRVTDVADVYSFESVPLEPIVLRSLQEFAANLKDGKFDVRVDVPEDVPAVRGDPTALGLMLNNLLDNAIRYSTDRRVIAISARRQNGAVALSIADRGVGIPASEIARVRRKFVRGSGTEKAGSGLGLAIVDRIVADHGGTLDILSEPGQGTSVTVTLPAVAS